MYKWIEVINFSMSFTHQTNSLFMNIIKRLLTGFSISQGHEHLKLTPNCFFNFIWKNIISLNSKKISNLPHSVYMSSDKKPRRVTKYFANTVLVVSNVFNTINRLNFIQNYISACSVFLTLYDLILHTLVYRQEKYR